MSAADHAVRPGPRVTIGGGWLTTSVVGDEAAPRLVLQHGVGSSQRFLLDAVAPPLVAAGWCVVTADLRGHGAASPSRDPAEHVLPQLAGDMAAVVAATGAIACGGISLGAHAAAAAITHHALGPLRLLAILPAATGQVEPTFGAHAAVAAEVRASGVAGMRARIADEDGIRPWLKAVLLRDLAASDDASLEAALLALPGATAPSIGDLLALPPGAGIVGWPDDPGHPLAVARAWMKAAPRSTLVTLDISEVDADPLALGHAAAAALGPPPP